jgi:hypothetical protein
VAVAAAPRVTGLVEANVRSATDSRSPKTVVAHCSEGKQILGGAGYVDGAGDHDSTMILTAMRPTGDDSVYGHGYAVTAAETPPGGDQTWAVRATAWCADPLPGHHIVMKSTQSSSPPMQEAVAPCPAGQRVLGTGANIDPVFVGVGYRNIGLQMVRAFGPGTNGVQAVRAQASELPAGYDHNWRLDAFAVCAATPDGYKVNTAVSELHDSYDQKHADVGCPSRRLVNHSAAVDTFTSPGWGAPGNITLLYTGVTLSTGTRDATAWENTPTSVNWVVEAQAICVE